MESLRDVKRVMEREIEKGSCPLQFEWLKLREMPFLIAINLRKYIYLAM